MSDLEKPPSESIEIKDQDAVLNVTGEIDREGENPTNIGFAEGQNGLSGSTTMRTGDLVLTPNLDYHQKKQQIKTEKAKVIKKHKKQKEVKKIEVDPPKQQQKSPTAKPEAYRSVIEQYRLNTSTKE